MADTFQFGICGGCPPPDHHPEGEDNKAPAHAVLAPEAILWHHRAVILKYCDERGVILTIHR